MIRKLRADVELWAAYDAPEGSGPFAWNERLERLTFALEVPARSVLRRLVLSDAATGDLLGVIELAPPTEPDPSTP